MGLEVRGPSTRLVGVAAGGDRIASVGSDGSVSLWDAEPTPPVLALTGHTLMVLCAAFSPDGRRLATGSQDQTVRLWDTQTGRALAVLAGPGSTVVHVAFNATGDRLTAQDDRGGTREWDVATGALVAPSPAGEALATPDEADRWTSADGRIVAYLSKKAMYLVHAPEQRVWERRFWMTRPDAAWHTEQAKRFAAARWPFAAKFHRAAAAVP